MAWSNPDPYSSPRCRWLPVYSLFHQLTLQRCLSTQTDGEVRIANKLREMFPSAASNAGPPNIHWHPRATDKVLQLLTHILIKFCSHKCK
uniref:Uncharacterized protein n=1 Tax=Oryzias latipes TaxID=8090 RepID=A0A3B3HW07_ORYLA